MSVNICLIHDTDQIYVNSSRNVLEVSENGVYVVCSDETIVFLFFYMVHNKY